MVAEPDLALVRRARTGDSEAFTLLMRRHQHRVYTLVRGIVRDEHEAADVTQETFIAVLRHLGTFQEGARFSTWLHQIALRKAYDHLRRRVPEPVEPEHAETAAGEGPDELDRSTMRADLLACLSTLDAGFRDAVLLVDVLGCSVEDAAQALDVAPGTVKSRVFRGRATLAVLLGTLGYDGASNR